VAPGGSLYWAALVVLPELESARPPASDSLWLRSEVRLRCEASSLLLLSRAGADEAAGSADLCASAAAAEGSAGVEAERPFMACPCSISSQGVFLGLG